MNKICLKCGCTDCFNYGFPCFKCAELCHKGILGPGYAPDKIRQLPINNIFPKTLINMRNWLKENPNVKYNIIQR